MNTERFQRIRELFDAASELQTDQQAAYVSAQCGDDADLVSEIQRLLLEDARDNAALDAPPLAAGGLLLPSVASWDALPERIGLFRVRRMLGHGGMGVVYEAQQDNPHRSVAVKVIRPGMESPVLWRRFQREINMLGQLQHPGIAQIYEAGITEVCTRFGDRVETVRRPYYAMELVHGQPLNRFAESQRLSVRARLSLFAAVCDAVHHAHQKGVVHRDLKPGNILVEQDPGDSEPILSDNSEPGIGRPKILDFGVARAIGPTHQSVTLQTDAGMMMGTIPYMSPEHVCGDTAQVDARSDVYALGVMLFELLSGHLPYTVADRSMPDAARAIRDDEPTRLSHYDSIFRGEVETIVAKALEKERSRRYQSAAELAMDIRRFLSDVPIAARPASSWYQLRKFAKRNRILVGGVISTITVLIAGLITTLHWARRENAQHREARRESYRSCIAAARAALRDHDVVSAVQFLDSAPSELRNWEWRHYRSRLDESLSIIDASRFSPGALSVSDDGSAILLATFDAGGQAWDLNSATSLTYVEPWNLTRAQLVRPRPFDRWVLRDLSKDDFVLSSLFDQRTRRIALAGAAVDSVGSTEPWAVVDRTWRAVLVSTPAPAPDAPGDDEDRANPATEPLSDRWSLHQPIAVSPSAKFLLDQDGKDLRAAFHVRELSTGKQLYRVAGHTDLLQSAAFSPDDSRLATVSRDGTVRLWDAATGAAVGVGRGHTDFVNTAAFNSDATLLATGASDRTVRLWQADTLAPAGVLVGHRTAVTRLGFAPDAPRLVSMDQAGMIRTWDVGGVPADRDTLRGHKSYVYALAFSSDGARLASGAWDGSVRIWNLSTNTVAKVLHARPICTDVCFSPDGRMLAASSNDFDWKERHITVWDAESGQQLGQMEAPCNCLFSGCLGFDSDGARLLFELPDRGHVRLWNLKADQLETHPVAALRLFSGGRAAPDGSLAVRFDREQDPKVPRCVVFDTATGADLWEASGSRGVPAAWWGFSRDGRMFITLGTTKEVYVHEARTGRQLGRLVGHTAEVMDGAFSPDGTRIATCGRDRSVRLWDTVTFAEITQLSDHTGYVRSVQFSPDGSTIASASGDHSVRLWRSRRGAMPSDSTVRAVVGER